MMNIFQTACLLQALLAAASTSADDFVPITLQGDASSVQSIHADIKCPDGESQTPLYRFTIEPGSEVGVSANVADLVVAEVADDGVLSFSWNSQVASGASSGGVKITMPADQLRSVVAGSGPGAIQILEGFTSIDTLEASGVARVYASLDDVQSDLSIKADGQAVVRMKSADLKSLVVDGQATVLADVVGSVEIVDLNGQSIAFVKTSGSVKNGLVTGMSAIHLSGPGKVIAEDGTATNVYRLPCANLKTLGEATCRSIPTSEWTVKIDLSALPATLSGTGFCYDSTSYDIDSTSYDSTSRGSTLSVSLAGLVAVAWLCLPCYK